MSDWQVGDLAVCVESGELTVAGRVYTVIEVILPGAAVDGTFNNHPIAALRFAQIGTRWRRGSDERRFRKILPDKHEECEPEFVTLLKRIKIGVAA